MPLMRRKPPEPTHVPGIIRGEETVLKRGHEPGRGNRNQYRGARDSTGINASDREPIHPVMPNIPPA